MIDENYYIRGQNPEVSIKKITPPPKSDSESERIKYNENLNFKHKTYTIRKLCEVRLNDKKENGDYVEESYNKLLEGKIVKAKKAMKCKSIKYGTDKEDDLNWYMCPRLYDKQTNRPLHWRMLKYTKINGNTFEPFDWGDEKNWRK